MEEKLLSSLAITKDRFEEGSQPSYSTLRVPSIDEIQGQSSNIFETNSRLGWSMLKKGKKTQKSLEKKDKLMKLIINEQVHLPQIKQQS